METEKPPHTATAFLDEAARSDDRNRQRQEAATTNKRIEELTDALAVRKDNERIAELEAELAEAKMKAARWDALIERLPRLPV